MRDLNNKHVLGIPATFGVKNCNTVFESCKSLLHINTNVAATNNIPSGNKFRIKSSSIPYVSSNCKYVYCGGPNICLLDNGSDAQKVAAWKFMVYLTQEANGSFAANSYYLPVCKSAFNSSEYKQFLNKPSESIVVNIHSGTNKVDAEEYQVSWNRFILNGFIGSDALQESVGQMAEQLLISHDSAENILEAAWNAING